MVLPASFTSSTRLLQAVSTTPNDLRWTPSCHQFPSVRGTDQEANDNAFNEPDDESLHLTVYIVNR